MTPTKAFSGPIVCGVDFSEQSRRALALAGSLAHALRVPLHIVTAIDPLLNEAAQAQYGQPERFLEDARRDLQQAAADALGPRSTDAAVDAVVGDSGPVLVAAAMRLSASIIVIGTQGLGRAHRIVFGSTTLRLMRTTSCPVLAVPPGMTTDESVQRDALWFDQIVCGVDFSAASTTAARAAVALGTALSVPVTLVHATGRAAVPQAWNLFAASATDRQAEAADVSLREMATALGEPAPAFDVVPGDAAEVIDERSSSALIVLGLGGASSQRPGSTAMRLLSLTRRAVLTVPA